MKILIIVPTYNEKENIEIIVEKTNAYDCDLLFVDDNSPDGTAQLIKDLGKSNKRLLLIERPEKMGLGSAYVEGFKYALNRGYERIVMMDADLSHPPSKISELLDADEDFVVGSRYIKGGNIVGWPWYRYLLSGGANIYASNILRINVSDLTGGFNCIKRKVLERINIDSLKGEGYAFIIELKHRSWQNGFKLKEVPITFKEREKGTSKISKNIIWEAFWLVLKLKFAR